MREVHCLTRESKIIYIITRLRLQTPLTLAFFFSLLGSLFTALYFILSLTDLFPSFIPVVTLKVVPR